MKDFHEFARQSHENVTRYAPFWGLQMVSSGWGVRCRFEVIEIGVKNICKEVEKWGWRDDSVIESTD